MNRDQFTSWINGASPDDAKYAAKQALGRVATLDDTHKQQFFDDVGRDPAVGRLLEEIKTTV